MTPIQHLEDVQGRMLRSLMPFHRGAWTLAHYRDAHTRRMHVVHLKPFTVAGDARMRVNHGRWLTDCPHCGSGIMTGRGWEEARCFECGACTRVVWPAEIDGIEALLRMRPIPNRNWEPGERLRVLFADNVRRGFDVLPDGVRLEVD